MVDTRGKGRLSAPVIVTVVIMVLFVLTINGPTQAIRNTACVLNFGCGLLLARLSRHLW